MPGQKIKIMQQKSQMKNGHNLLRVGNGNNKNPTTPFMPAARGAKRNWTLENLF
jgi:hypothetical protein